MTHSSRRLIEINDRMICVRVRGQGPTIILEAGGAGEGTTDSYGERFEERLAGHATVVSYDRAGSGRSDGPLHRSVATMADDLAAVIRAVGCPTPVVVVGWSSGGLVAEMFAVRHPELLSGLVLLDPTVATMASRMGQRAVFAVGVVQLEIAALASRLGVFRTRVGRAIIARLAGPYADRDGREYWTRTWNQPRSIRQTARVLPLIDRYYLETSTVLDAASLPSVPVRVVVPRERAGGRVFVERIAAAHRRVAERFPRGELVVMDDTGHGIPIDQPDAALATILEVLDQTSRPGNDPGLP